MTCRGERGQGEGDCDEQTVGGADAKRQRIDRDAGFDGQHIARNRADDRGRERADDQPRRDRHRRDREDLQAIDARDGAAVGAEHLQSREARAFAREIARDPVTDADPGNDERREADERQELSHALDEAPRAGRAVAAVGDVPPRVGEFGGERFADGFGVRAVGQADAIFALVKASRLDQLRRGQVGKPDDRDRTERETFA